MDNHETIIQIYYKSQEYAWSYIAETYLEDRIKVQKTNKRKILSSYLVLDIMQWF